MRDSSRAVVSGWIMLVVMLIAGGGYATTCTWTGAWDTSPTVGDTIVIASGGDLTWSNTMPQTVASWTQEAGYSATRQATDGRQ